uniref:Uncharacterized protein n=1 Tax=Peronospora matthiolae TaxID=2874970 RepID=A0AAV1UH56_9STRA
MCLTLEHVLDLYLVRVCKSCTLATKKKYAGDGAQAKLAVVPGKERPSDGHLV